MTETELWVDYETNPCVETRNAIYEHYARTVESETASFLRHRRCQHILDDTLSKVSEHVLMVLIPSFNRSEGVPFRRYLHCQIRTAIREILRSNAPGQYSRRQSQSIDNCRCRLSHKAGRRVTDAEVAQAMLRPESDVIAFQDQGHNVPLDSDPPDDGHEPSTQHSAIVDAINAIPNDYKATLYEHFVNGKTHAEIAASQGRSRQAVTEEIGKSVRFLKNRIAKE